MLPSEGGKGTTTGRGLLDRLSDAVLPFFVPVGTYRNISLQWGQPKSTPMRSRTGLAELRPAYLEFRAVRGLQRDESRIARVDHLARVPVHLDCIARVQPLGGGDSLQFVVGHAYVLAKGVP